MAGGWMRRLVSVGALLALVVGVFVQPGAARQATFPGGNGRIAYDVQNDIWTVNPDGSGKLNVTRGRFPGPEAPAWSADGARIAFAAANGIWVIGADGSRAKQVTQESNYEDTDPAWSPDGSQLVFSRDADGARLLYVVTLDGSGLHALTPQMAAGAQNPAWSPDGSTIAFDDGNDLWSIGADGSGLRQLTGYGSPADAPSGIYPSWSPDGRLLAYKGCVDVASCNIYTIAPDGSSPATVVSGLYESWELAWSPDGSRIALVNDANTPAQEQLFVVNADGSNLSQLNLASDTNLDWGPACAVVPNVVGKTLAAAKTALAAVVHVNKIEMAFSYGKITWTYSAPSKKGHVLSQQPRPGVCLAGAKVSFVVGKGK